jgi:hypothetical protein
MLSWYTSANAKDKLVLVLVLVHACGQVCTDLVDDAPVIILSLTWYIRRADGA